MTLPALPDSRHQPASLAIYCSRCGELAILATLPPQLPIAPMDARFVLRQAARLLTRSAPLMRSVLEHAINGRYSAALAELQDVYDAGAAKGNDGTLCGPCVHADRAAALEATHTIETTRLIELGEPVMVTKTRRLAAKVSR